MVVCGESCMSYTSCSTGSRSSLLLRMGAAAEEVAGALLMGRAFHI